MEVRGCRNQTIRRTYVHSSQWSAASTTTIPPIRSACAIYVASAIIRRACISSSCASPHSNHGSSPDASDRWADRVIPGLSIAGHLQSPACQLARSPSNRRRPPSHGDVSSWLPHLVREAWGRCLQVDSQTSSKRVACVDCDVSLRLRCELFVTHLLPARARSACALLHLPC